MVYGLRLGVLLDSFVLVRFGYSAGVRLFNDLLPINIAQEFLDSFIIWATS